MKILPQALTQVVDERGRAARTEGYRTDVGAWWEYMTGGQMWSVQQKIANDLQTHKNVAVKACHGSGKATALTEIIPTEHGYTTMGEI